MVGASFEYLRTRKHMKMRGRPDIYYHFAIATQ
jgi:hypothetical protein